MIERPGTMSRSTLAVFIHIPALEEGLATCTGEGHCLCADNEIMEALPLADSYLQSICLLFACAGALRSTFQSWGMIPSVLACVDSSMTLTFIVLHHWLWETWSRHRGCCCRSWPLKVRRRSIVDDQRALHRHWRKGDILGIGFPSGLVLCSFIILNPRNDSLL
jgi:hypothetical protein